MLHDYFIKILNIKKILHITNINFFIIKKLSKFKIFEVPYLCGLDKKIGTPSQFCPDSVLEYL